MKHALLAFVLLATQVILAEPCFGQFDVLAEHKVRGLKGFRTLAVVLRLNALREIATPKEWGDMVELGLHRHVPELKVSTANVPTWLELSVVTTNAGGFLELSVYRWVKVLDLGEEIVAKVWWDSRSVFGGVSKGSLQEVLDAILTSFAADYLRAKR